jgi:hypothetical protein
MTEYIKFGTDYFHPHFFFCGSTAQFLALAASMKLSILFRLLDLGQSAGLLGRVIKFIFAMNQSLGAL